MGNGFDKSHPYYTPVAAENLNAVVKSDKHEIEIKQTEALTSLAKGINDIAAFVTQGGLQAAMSAHTKGALLQGIFNGLASHGGRNSLDARTIKQNALEAVELVMAAFDKMHERIQDKNRDPEIKEPSE